MNKTQKHPKTPTNKLPTINTPIKTKQPQTKTQTHPNQNNKTQQQ